AVLLALSLAVGSGGCFTGEEGDVYYGRVVVPSAQEFRWSDGGLPQVFDPALAAAPPDTDAIRALYEGLTDHEPHTLAPVSGVAEKWEPAEGGRVWTFRLRRDARWSNGDAVTAHDFVRSWRRTLRLGERAPHAGLLENILGASQELRASTATAPAENLNGGEAQTERPPSLGSVAVVVPAPQPSSQVEPQRPQPVEPFGVEAVDEHTLRVRLRRPDVNFASLVAHPVFRPVHHSQAQHETEASRAAGDQFGPPAPPEPATALVSNGAFRLSRQAGEEVVLERAASYWNAPAVSLDRVRFVALRGAEAALAAYRAGAVDAVTNTSAEPLAVKLLAPYKDFRRSTFGAITYYQFNRSSPPFDDLRVRQALALAVDRERLSADVLSGAVEPAAGFLPGDADKSETEDTLRFDPSVARKLLAEAGYSGGEGFPRVRLLINRNEQHRQVAQAVASMWRRTLGIQTEVVAKDWADYEDALASSDYDIARRSLVMQSLDEETNLLSMFGGMTIPTASTPALVPETADASPSPASSPDVRPPGGESSEDDTEPTPAEPIRTEREALAELPAMPIYFATSFALVKPYVSGFDSNLFDAPSLQRVRIDTGWQPPKRAETIRPVRAE
ncbi:MAG: peptide ABC transporter substrate-binding protein, partial [Pyrinomonadaceae bacterium]